MTIQETTDHCVQYNHTHHPLPSFSSSSTAFEDELPYAQTMRNRHSTSRCCLMHGQRMSLHQRGTTQVFSSSGRGRCLPTLRLDAREDGSVVARDAERMNRRVWILIGDVGMFDMSEAAGALSPPKLHL